MPHRRAHSSQSVDLVRTALEDLQKLVTQLVEDRVGRVECRGIDLVRVLGIDLKLAWKIGRIRKASGPFECVRYLPGPKGVRVVCDAAARAGAPPELVQSLRDSFAAVKKTGLAWAGDSRAFELLSAGLASRGDPRADLEHRKDLFLAGSYVWGIRANTLLRLDVLHPASDGATIETITVRGYQDVERLRADAPWNLEVPFCVDDAATHAMSVSFEPLDADDKGRGAPFFMKRFCSPDMPKFETPKVDRIPRAVELPVGAVGIECRFTIFHGAIVRGAMPAHRTPDNAVACLMHKIQTPCERVVFDTWVHKDLAAEDWVPTGSMFSVLDGWRGQFSHQDRDRLPIAYEIREVESGKRGVLLEGFELMPELVGSTFARVGWDSREFRHFRTEVLYPPVPSTMTFDIALPE